jgi:hypothetical protein
MNWQSMDTAPRDGTWILGLNNRGNCAVIIWSKSASSGIGRAFYPGWIHPFSMGELSTFWNGANGSLPIAWTALPSGDELKILLKTFGGNEMVELNRMREPSGLAAAMTALAE